MARTKGIPGRAGGSSRSGRTFGLWIFDFDGTLSPIVPDRNAARLDPACRALLAKLSAVPGEVVAVLSSRSIDDLAPRVPLRDLILCGASGLEWLLPDGRRIRPGRRAAARRETSRAALKPLFAALSGFPGVDVEDKGWSVAIHYRRVPPEDEERLESLLGRIALTPGVRTFRGPCVAEVQLLPGVDKSFGVRRICRFLEFDPSKGRLFYAGDDESDETAMRWVLRRGGTAFSVRRRAGIPGAGYAADPAALAEAVGGMALRPGALPGIRARGRASKSKDKGESTPA